MLQLAAEIDKAISPHCLGNLLAKRACLRAACGERLGGDKGNRASRLMRAIVGVLSALPTLRFGYGASPAEIAAPESLCAVTRQRRGTPPLSSLYAA